LDLVRTWVAENGLALHPTKTKVVDVRTEGFDFLGYHFRDTRHWPRDKSTKKLKDAIRAKTRRTDGDSLQTIITSLNRTLRGWFTYFQQSRPWIFGVLDRWIRGRLRSILRNRHKGRGRGRGKDHNRWPNAFFADLGLFSLAKAHALARQPSLR
jgi:RNA-directed DNA polymerase